MTPIGTPSKSLKGAAFICALGRRNAAAPRRGALLERLAFDCTWVSDDDAAGGREPPWSTLARAFAGAVREPPLPRRGMGKKSGLGFPHFIIPF